MATFTTKKNRVINFKDVNDEDAVPKGSYQVEVRKWKRAVSKKTNALMIEVSYRIGQPEKFAGLSLRDRFVIGEAGSGEEDQWGLLHDDEIDRTLFGTRAMKRALKAAHVPVDGESEIGEILDNYVGQELIVYVENELYEGVLRPNVKGHYAIGEKEPGVFEAPTEVEKPVVTRLAARRPRTAVPA